MVVYFVQNKPPRSQVQSQCFPSEVVLSLHPGAAHGRRSQAELLTVTMHGDSILPQRGELLFRAVSATDCHGAGGDGDKAEAGWSQQDGCAGPAGRSLLLIYTTFSCFYGSALPQPVQSHGLGWFLKLHTAKPSG